MRAIACLAVVACLASCAGRLREMIEAGPAAFADPKNPAILAAEAEATEEKALLELLR